MFSVLKTDRSPSPYVTSRQSSFSNVEVKFYHKNTRKSLYTSCINIILRKICYYIIYLNSDVRWCLTCNMPFNAIKCFTTMAEWWIHCCCFLNTVIRISHIIQFNWFLVASVLTLTFTSPIQQLWFFIKTANDYRSKWPNYDAPLQKTNIPYLAGFWEAEITSLLPFALLCFCIDLLWDTKVIHHLLIL